MSRIDELNEAIAILREECSNHETCEGCPLGKSYTYMICQLNDDPWRWEKMEEQK